MQRRGNAATPSPFPADEVAGHAHLSEVFVMEKREPAALLVPRLTVSLFAAIKFRKPGDVKDLLSFRSTFSAGPRHKDFLLKITMRYLANGFPEPAIRCRGNAEQGDLTGQPYVLPFTASQPLALLGQKDGPQPVNVESRTET